MALPLRAPAPGIAAHARVFRDLCEHQGPWRHGQPDLTGLLMLPTTSLAHLARCLLDSADNPPLARFCSEARGCEDEGHRRRRQFRLPQPQPPRRRRRASRLVLDETLGDPVGRRFDDGARHDPPGAGPAPLAPNPGTRGAVSGPGRCPVGWRLERRDAERTPGAAAVAQPVPALHSPRDNQARHRLHPQGAPGRLQAPEWRARHAPCRPPLALASEVVAEAIRPNVPGGVVGCAAWSLAEDGVQVLARRRQAWRRLLNTTRRLEPARLPRREAHGWTRKRPRPHMAGAARGPLIPATASRAVQGGAHTSGGCTRPGRIPGLGQGRRVVSCAHASCTGRRVVLVTNRRDWSVATIISLDSPRWPPDTCEQDGQGHVGCQAERRRRTEAMGQHWGLVFVASAWLPLTCLPTGPGRTQRLIHTSGAACRPQGRAVLQTLGLFVHNP